MQRAEIPPSSAINETSNGRDISKDRPIRFIAILSVSVILCILFLFSSTVQTNDPNGIQWLVFYALHAIIPATFIIDVFFSFPHILIYAFGTIMAIWSIVFLVISSLEFSKPIRNDEFDGDNAVSQTQQAIFDLAGSILTLISAIYHMVRIYKTKKDE